MYKGNSVLSHLQYISDKQEFKTSVQLLSAEVKCGRKLHLNCCRAIKLLPDNLRLAFLLAASCRARGRCSKSAA